MILEKACWYLNSTAKQIHPSLQCSFRLTPVTHSISLSCVRARVVTYYTKVFSGNTAFTEPGLCMNTRLFFQRTQNGKLADLEEIFSIILC